MSEHRALIKTLPKFLKFEIRLKDMSSKDVRTKLSFKVRLCKYKCKLKSNKIYYFYKVYHNHNLKKKVVIKNFIDLFGNNL